MAEIARPEQAPFRLCRLTEVDSTSSEAMRRAVAGERSGLWILADQQSRGRGRSGRTWQSPAGNLYTSLLLELGCEPVVAQQISLVAGVAAIEALRSDEPWTRRLRLKWPNDILYEGAKLGGILVECTTVMERRIAVIGIGINVVIAPEDLGRAVTSLAAHSTVPLLAPEGLMGRLMPSMRHWLDVWREGAGFDAIRAAWLERAGPSGEAVTVKTESGEFAGAFAGLDPTGALLVRDAGGGERRFAFGEVSLGGDGRA